MLKKSVTYTNFNDEVKTTELWFNINETELLELNKTHDGGIQGFYRRIVDSQDGPSLMLEIRTLMLIGYGEKSDDGERFEKDAAMKKRFSESAAFSALFRELGSDAEQLAAFIEGMLPKELVEEAKAQAAAEASVDVANAPAPPPPPAFPQPEA